MGNCLLDKTAMHDDGDRGEWASGFNLIGISLFFIELMSDVGNMLFY